MPVPRPEGPLPALRAGESLLLVDGRPAQVVIEIVDDTAQQVRGEDFVMSLLGTEVDVWLLSTPTYLGALLVQPDGSFDGLLPIGQDITAGDHTLHQPEPPTHLGPIRPCTRRHPHTDTTATPHLKRPLLVPVIETIEVDDLYVRALLRNH